MHWKVCKNTTWWQQIKLFIIVEAISRCLYPEPKCPPAGPQTSLNPATAQEEKSFFLGKVDLIFEQELKQWSPTMLDFLCKDRSWILAGWCQSCGHWLVLFCPGNNNNCQQYKMARGGPHSSILTLGHFFKIRICIVGCLKNKTLQPQQLLHLKLSSFKEINPVKYTYIH